MSKRQLIMILGVLILVMPFLGFPSSWKNFFEIVFGAVIVIIAYAMAPKVKSFASSDRPFVEHKSDGITNSDSSGQQ